MLYEVAPATEFHETVFFDHPETTASPVGAAGRSVSEKYSAWTTTTETSTRIGLVWISAWAPTVGTVMRSGLKWYSPCPRSCETFSAGEISYSTWTTTWEIVAWSGIYVFDFTPASIALTSLTVHAAAVPGLFAQIFLCPMKFSARAWSAEYASPPVVRTTRLM